MTRHFDFDGIHNFRDFGGYATACGRRLKSGRLFRSANHHHASDADLARMRELGLAVIVDLRQPDERTREPSRRWDGFACELVQNDLTENHLDFIGLRQAGWRTPSGGYRPPTFVESGLYALVRHPMMVGLLIAFWCTPRMSAGHLLFAAAASGYVVVGIRLEERDLRREVGPTYDRYAEQVPALVPRPRRPRSAPRERSP